MTNETVLLLRDQVSQDRKVLTGIERAALVPVEDCAVGKRRRYLSPQVAVVEAGGVGQPWGHGMAY